MRGWLIAARPLLHPFLFLMQLQISSLRRKYMQISVGTHQENRLHLKKGVSLTLQPRQFIRGRWKVPGMRLYT
jgi:hypothetical protein